MTARRASPKKGPPSHRAPYHHGDLRRALLDEALRIIREQGPAAVSLRELARRLGVSYAAPHYHFTEKDDLFAAIATAAFEDLMRSIAARIETISPPAPSAVLYAAAEGYLEFAREDPARYEVMFLPQLRDRVRFAELHGTGGRALDLLSALFEQAEGVPPERARARAVACWSALHGFAVLVNAGFLDDEAATGKLSATVQALLDSVVVVRQSP